MNKNQTYSLVEDFKRMICFYCLPVQVVSFGDLATEADRRLFNALVTDPRHVLGIFSLRSGPPSITCNLGPTASSSHQRITAISSSACCMKISIASDASACAGNII